jgi:hypothetical protein
MNPIKSLDELIAQAIADYNNLDYTVDLSQGSPEWFRTVTFMTAIFGLYVKHADILKQLSPLTCDSDRLSEYAARYGITRETNESDQSLLDRLLLRLRHPPAGGNAYDYESWAKSVTVSEWPVWVANTDYSIGDVCKPSSANGYIYICSTPGTSGATEPTNWSYSDNDVMWQLFNSDTFVEKAIVAKIYKNPRGKGTIDVVVESNNTHINYEKVPSNLLLSAIYQFIDRDDVRPLIASDFTVQKAARKIQSITFTVPIGTSQLVKNKIAGDIVAYMQSLSIGETLYPTPLSSVAYKNGLPEALLTTPTLPVTCYPTEYSGFYERFWATLSDITITEV